jgi:SET domain
MWATFVEGTEYRESRVMGSFHNTQEEWEQLWYGKSLKEIRIQEGLRTDEWLREHGTCADNIREGESTIRQAGRGAFASRRLVKDSIIAPMPLIHIGDYHILDMYAFEDIRQFKLEPGPRLIGTQLTLNYCFGHRDSTLLLCPYGPLTSLINHNRTQANVRIQWPKTAKGNHDPTLLERPLEHFAQDRTTKLAMELVANREIMPGEELFLDYGDAWENAWNEYIGKWKPQARAENYVSALELNTSPDPLRTEFEQMEDPYPRFVLLQCNQAFFNTIDYPLFQETGEIKVVDYFASKWFNCEILRYRFEKNRFLYTAVLMLEEGKHDKLVDVPREAVRFMDKPYTSDFLLPDAFRHAMMIPDEMFPEYWMNI